jgi:hypothetical protein
MSRFHRRTATKVRDGRVQPKNNWRRSPNCYRVPQWVPAIDRRRPGDGYRHLLLKRDIERFVDLLPHWEDVSRGLDVIVLDRGGQGCDGWYNSGVLALCAWPVNLVDELDNEWYEDHRDFLDPIGFRVEDQTPEKIRLREEWGLPVADDQRGPFVAHWTPDTARAYQLCHVFLHELGHHIDRMCTRSRTDIPRGEDWAEQYAWAYEVMVLERYFEEFGLPE